MGKISVVINTFNNEDNVSMAILSVKNLADEIVVCDMESSDNTSDIAKKLGAKVYSHKKEKYVELVRNFMVSKATCDWILILDPDEEIPSKLSFKLKEIIKNSQADYFRIPRKNIIFGKWMKHSRWWPDYNIRFFKKGFVSWNEIIHSVPMTQGKGIDLPDKEEIALIHHHYDSVSGYLEKMLRYTDAQRDGLLKAGYVFSWKDLIKKPTNEFLSRYFDGEGYKDGIHGLALSLLQAFSELTLYLKVWEKQGFDEKNLEKSEIKTEINKVVSDLKWWLRKKLSWLKFLS
ncbi:MAG: glycosyltransferase family 2 protein [Candidatus Woesebacteria bacterium]|nr:glycosyltransferase family 2 protein [Candidatus Woesebacteria bacterium]